jgi:uncharacterized membrane protein
MKRKFKKQKNYIKENYEAFAIILIIGFILVISLILFVLDLFNCSFITITHEYDWLAYAGGIFSAISTLILGYISIKQNSNLREINQDIRQENLKINSKFDFAIGPNIYFIHNLVSLNAFRLIAPYYKKNNIKPKNILRIGFYLVNSNNCNITSYYIKNISLGLITKENGINSMELVAVDKDFIYINKKSSDISSSKFDFVEVCFYIDEKDLTKLKTSKRISLEFECLFKNNLNVISTKIISLSVENSEEIIFDKNSYYYCKPTSKNIIDKGIDFEKSKNIEKTNYKDISF